MNMQIIKSKAVIGAVAAILGFCGCATTKDHSHRDGRTNQLAVDEKLVHRRLETIAYYWESFRIKVSFYRSVPGERWTMTVFDSWDIYDQYQEEGKVWGVSESRCSTEECLRMIDRSLEEFHAEKPDARLEMVAIEMHVIRDLWGEILTGASRKLSTLDGEKTSSRADVPPGLGDEFESVFAKSPTIKGISELLQKHRMKVRAINVENQLAFKDSLTGRNWSDIATLPGVGVLVPGTIGFDLGESQTDTGKKGLAVSQSVSQ